MKTFEEVYRLLRTELERVAGDLGADVPVILERPKDETHGDISTNLAMLLAPLLKKAPRVIAEEISEILRLPPKVFQAVDIAGPGFLNFTLSPVFLRGGLELLLAEGEKYGRLTVGSGKTAQVEFVSANPTGPLTIGHGRQAVIGDVIARILENASYSVEREYYFNDAGRQLRLLGESIRAHYLRLLGEKHELPEGGYVGDYVETLARSFLERKGKISPVPELEVFTRYGKEETFASIKLTLDRMGIHFDNFYSEKSLYDSGRIDSTIKAMKEAGILYEKDGAQWIEAMKLGLDQDWVMVRSTGEPTYRLPDIAYHIHKLERGLDLVVDVFGADHQATYPVVMAAVKALGKDISGIRVIIHQFVTLKKDGQEVKMSKRKGEFLTLDFLLDEVGMDAVRYFYILRMCNSHLSFDIDLARKESEENPVFYVQYGHARISGVLRFAEGGGYSRSNGSFDVTLLKEPEELALMKRLLLFPELTRQVLETLEPQRITVYLRDVATAFHQFYHFHRVIGEDHELSKARLALVKASKTVLSRGLGLLGVTAPERM